MPEKLYVRYATPADERAVFDFYADNRHAFVLKRDPDVWRERIAAGAVTIIHDENGEILASSISYPLMKKDAAGNDVHAWTEIGSTRVAVEGIGLFKALIAAQIVRAFLLEPPDDCFAMEIAEGNKHSRHVFTKHGAVPFDIPDELRAQSDATVIPGHHLVMEWFRMGPECIPQLAKNLLDLVRSGQVTDRNSGKEYEFDFSRCAIVQKFFKEIEAITSSHYGHAVRPDPAATISSVRRNFGPL